MDEKASQVSRVIEGVSRAIAEWTVGRHADLDPGLAARYGEGWRGRWVEDVRTRIGHLCQAVALEQPGLFGDSVVWSGASFAARDVRLDDLRGSLEAMREVLISELPDAVAESAVGHVDDAITRLGDGVPAPPTAVGLDRPSGRLTLEFLEALLDGRVEDAQRLVLDAAEQGVPIMQLHDEVIQPAQVEMGRMWHLNEISIADEHLATAAVQMLLGRLRAFFPRVEPNGRRAVVTAVDGDLHDIGVRMVSDALEMAGWDVAFFGANLPVTEVIGAMQDRETHLLAASANTSLHVRALADLVQAVRSSEVGERVAILVGGVPFLSRPDLWRAIGADGCARSASEAVTLARTLVDERQGAA